jgi:hypothetical protein
MAKNIDAVDKLPFHSYQRPMARTTKKKATIRKPGSVGTLKKRRPPKTKPVTPPDPPILAKCYFCPREVDEGEFKCEGCGEVVCDTCDELSPWGKHEPFEHTADGSEED